jgi:hypothetical protein
MAGGKGRKTKECISTSAAKRLLTREEFAKFSEMEGLPITDDIKKMFAQFDRRNLTHAERRAAIIAKFKRRAD